MLEWDWTPPISANSHSCLLIVVDCPGDPIPAANKVFNIGTLVTREKRVGLKNLHVVNAVPGPYATGLTVYGQANGADVLRLGALPPGWSLGLLIPEKVVAKTELKGLKQGAATKAQKRALSNLLRRELTASESKNFFALTIPEKGALISKVPTVKDGFPLLLVWQAGGNAQAGRLDVIQTTGHAVIGGDKFFLCHGKSVLVLVIRGFALATLPVSP